MELSEFLMSRKDYVSGQEIADAMGISRNAVWKQIERLRREGVQVEAVTGKGYRIKDLSMAFGAGSIGSLLDTKWLGRELLFYEEIDSTNEELKRRAAKGAREGLMAVADIQNAGKGRRGRGWENPGGVNIAMSYLLRPDMNPDTAPMMTLIMAMAAREGIEKVTGLKTLIKWPNDVVINGKKVVGILTEMTAEPDYIHEVIIGTGINVNTESFDGELKDKATSLYIEGGVRYSRSGITAEVTNSFEKLYEGFLKTGDLSGLKDEYNSICVNTGCEVCVLDPAGSYEGVACGIDDKGELIVKKEGGETVAVYAGEVSVRGIYGYV